MCIVKDFFKEIKVKNNGSDIAWSIVMWWTGWIEILSTISISCIFAKCLSYLTVCTIWARSRLGEDDSGGVQDPQCWYHTERWLLHGGYDWCDWGQ